MKIIALTAIVWLCYVINLQAQTLAIVKGKIIDASSQSPIQYSTISVKNTSILTQTGALGYFNIENVPTGNQVIQIKKKSYKTVNIPIQITRDSVYNLGEIMLYKTTSSAQHQDFIFLDDSDFLDDEASNSNYISGLFQQSKDVFLQAAAYSFSQAWFKVRGYSARNGKVLINGVTMNKLYNNTPQWSNWGGLNDVFKNQTVTTSLNPSKNTFGGVLGATNYSTKASAYEQIKKASISSTNKTYLGRFMLTYASGLTKEGWSFVASGSRRYAQESYFEGTLYNAWAAFLSVEKKVNEKHSFNITGFTSFNRRGKTSPNTQEVYDLKGYKYNAYWGIQEHDVRNSRMKEISEPVIMFTHYYTPSKLEIRTTFAYQFGHIGNSRLGYFNAPNPDPTYWKYLPSSYLRFPDNPDYENAYLATQEFLKNGQINWRNIYEINVNNGNSLYYLYEDRTDDTQLSANTNITTNITSDISLNIGVSAKKLTSKNYSNMLDLLGGLGFVDLDQYATGEAQQNNLNNPNNLVQVGEKFQYNYIIKASEYASFAQIQSTLKKIDYFVAASVENKNYQRKGLFKNGTYASNSFGNSEKQSFLAFSFKGGLTYKLTGRHLLSVNGALISNSPSIKNTFSNARVNNNITPNLKNEKIQTLEFNYHLRFPKLKIRTTLYYTKFKNAIENSFFFAEGLLGNQADFVSEITTGIDKKHLGIELSTAFQVTPQIKILGAGALGSFTYSNNPRLYIQSESFVAETSDFGNAFLKNYHVSGTPQQAYFLGFEYRDPDFWWYQINANYLANNYLDISPLLRTNNFYLDADGVPFVDEDTGAQVTQNQIDELLTQEKFKSSFLLNVVGGKTWKLNKKYIGFFAGINNILGVVFKTGGFEQSRNANYIELKKDKQLEKPIFGPKYWYGNNTTYYLNCYVRF